MQYYARPADVGDTRKSLAAKYAVQDAESHTRHDYD
jgi:hypothetical protein